MNFINTALVPAQGGVGGMMAYILSPNTQQLVLYAQGANNIKYERLIAPNVTMGAGAYWTFIQAVAEQGGGYPVTAWIETWKSKKVLVGVGYSEEEVEEAIDPGGGLVPVGGQTMMPGMGMLGGRGRRRGNSSTDEMMAQLLARMMGDPQFLKSTLGAVKGVFGGGSAHSSEEVAVFVGNLVKEQMVPILQEALKAQLAELLPPLVQLLQHAVREEVAMVRHALKEDQTGHDMASVLLGPSDSPEELEGAQAVAAIAGVILKMGEGGWMVHGPKDVVSRFERYAYGMGFTDGEGSEEEEEEEGHQEEEPPKGRVLQLTPSKTQGGPPAELLEATPMQEISEADPDEAPDEA